MNFGSGWILRVQDSDKLRRAFTDRGPRHSPLLRPSIQFICIQEC